MLDNFKIGDVQRAISPNPFCLISAIKPDGGTNLTALSWWSFASNRPPTVTICISKKGYSRECILLSGQFVINFPSEQLKESAFKCGTCTGRNVDKALDFGIDLVPSKEVLPMRVRDVKAAMECVCIESVELSDHTLYVAEVKNIFVDKDVSHLYSFDGYSRLDTLK